MSIVATVFAGAVGAQTWPSKPLHVIVPFPPGGAVDILGRAVGQKLGDALGESVVIDNRAGAGGVVGTEAAAKSPADGYTLLMGSTSTISINPALVSKPTYDPAHDFLPISQLAFVPHMLVIGAAVPTANLREFIAYVKANPGRVNYASAGNGTPHHIAGEMFKQAAGVDMVHVPYKGNVPAITDLLAGQTALIFATMPTVLPHTRAGKLRALATTGIARAAATPELPTVAETLPGFVVNNWVGLFAPAGTPPEIVSRLNAETRKFMQSKEIAARLASEGARFVPMTPDQFGVFVKAEVAKWAPVVKASGARAD